jgi:hypothetical protein
VTVKSTSTSQRVNRSHPANFQIVVSPLDHGKIQRKN